MSATCTGFHSTAVLAAAIVFVNLASVVRADDARPPQVGQTAPDFTLQRLDGQSLQLSKLCEQGPVVIVVLRGHPGYQCPLCNRQVGQLLSQQRKFAAAMANVVLVYPGPADGLRQHAQEFVTGKTIPDRFHLLLDPDYAFTNAYGLRWDAPQETAYPSTFVVAPNREVKFAQISHTHGDRANVADVLAALSK